MARAVASVFRVIVVALLLVTNIGVAKSFGQGLLVDAHDHFRLPRPIRPIPPPQPTASYKIKELSIRTRIVDQVAKVQVSQTFENTGSIAMEVAFLFPLPYDGAIDQMTFMVDGKEYAGKLLTATEARSIYEGYVRRQKDPALLEWMGTGLFKTSVFPVPPGASRTVSLRYSQICRRDQGLISYTLPLSTAKYTSQPIENVNWQVALESKTSLKNIYSPTHSIDIARQGNTQATISFSAKQTIPQDDFRLFYGVGDEGLATSVMSYRPDSSDDGYLLMLVSPDFEPRDTQPVPKSVVLVVDRSGSMNGPKIEQAKEAMRYVLNNLRAEDTFNIVAYDTEVESFRPELQRYTDDTRAAALGFVSGIFAGGSTNIDGALQAALRQLQDKERPSYVLFLTDGLPTVGETNTAKIVANSKQYNQVAARLMTFGVGHDVNSRFLDQLVEQHRGQGQYVRPQENIEAYVSRLYDYINAPVLTNVTVGWDIDGWRTENGPVINRFYPRGDLDLFAGQQLVLVGRYLATGPAKVTLSGTVSGSQRSFSFPAELTARSNDETYAFVEKLWAVRRVGEIVQQIDLHGKNDELVNELVALATKHGIVTPYTSFLADENSNLADLSGRRRETELALRQLSAESGRSGFDQRASNAQLQRARVASPDARYGGGYGGGGYGAGNSVREAIQKANEPSRGALAGGPAADALRSEAVVEPIKYVGAKTFFWRNGQWVDSLVIDGKESTQKIKRFSDDYFSLIAKHGKDAAKYLALEGTVVLRIGDTIYQLED